MELTELEERVLAELAEFWRENFPALANAVSDGTGTDAEFESVRAAFEGLVTADLVMVGVGGVDASRLERLSKEDSQAILAQIAQHLQFKVDGSHWTGGERPWPELVITEAGHQQAKSILEKHGGERWWQRSN
jgi:hypothetical protein